MNDQKTQGKGHEGYFGREEKNNNSKEAVTCQARWNNGEKVYKNKLISEVNY